MKNKIIDFLNFKSDKKMNTPNSNIPSKMQDQLRLKLKMLDDVFHRTVIALERLETFLETERRINTQENHEQKSLVQTAIKSSRDLHDYEKHIPTIGDVMAEAQLQCSALYFQTKIDDRDMFEKTMHFFLKDLLEWYGGRGDDIPYNQVEAFFLPIMISLSRQIRSVTEVMQVIETYVGKIRTISDLNEEDKRKAVEDGMAGYLRGIERYNEDMRNFNESTEEFLLTSHIRGNAIDGYKRLFLSFLKLYNEGLPAKLLVRTVEMYLPEVAASCLDITEVTVDSFFENKNIQDNQ